MNLALYLERAGREDGERPALGLGTRILRNYGDVAGRVARLAGALQAMGLKPGERVAIAAKNSPDYVEVLYAIWHAGLAAVPANAKLHGAELGYILEQSGARVCFASPDVESAIAAHAPKPLERLISIGGAEYERLLAHDAGRGRAARARRSRLAVLHLRHDRPAEGRDAHPQGAGCREQRLPERSRHRSRPAIRSCTPRR